MKTAKLLCLFFLLTGNLVSSQIKGIVIDAATKNPIPYVSIWIENENNGTTAEENGQFQLTIASKSKNLLFSALGYEKKTMAISSDMKVEMTPSTIELNEVQITKKYGTRQIEIGETESPFLQAYENGPRIDIKFFPYKAKYKKTKFIKQIVLNTDCRIEEATLKLHLYKVDNAGLPGDELLEKDYIATVSKGVKKTLFNLSAFNLRMPKDGIFVGFERLKVEKNKFEKTIRSADNQGNVVQTTFCPFVLYNQVERDYSYTFSGGKWTRESTTTAQGASNKKMIYEPAINLILVN
ncbi:MAG: carboxypeptidase-like regulatory domain-containing protein [Flavobacterium sp.]|nr:carboxypeptidase-like regulatory domain-containing protein [Flavobacterium sp.]